MLLWHPVETSADEIDAWRGLLVERRIVQPFKQAFRETYGLRGEPDAVLDARFADRPLAHAQLRALLGARGWTAPMLGPFDQGDRAVSYRQFPGTGLRAEFGYLPAGAGDPSERVAFARSGSVRFTADLGGARQPVLIQSVPARLVSEVLRDIDLFTSVPDPMRSPTSTSADEGSPLLASRADALRRAIPSLPFAKSVSVVGLWLRVQSGGRAWAISMAGGATLRLPEEDLVSVPLDEPLPDIGYLPVDEDETLRRIVATAAKLLGPV